MMKNILIALGILVILSGAVFAASCAKKKPEDTKNTNAEEKTDENIENNESETTTDETGILDESGVADESGVSDESDPVIEELAGAFDFSKAHAPKLSENEQAVFDKALAELVGVGYEPLTVLGTQVVAGTNYAFLCKSTVVYPDAKPYISVVYVYADLNGNASILSIKKLEECFAEESNPTGLAGGWQITDREGFADNSLSNRALGKALETEGVLQCDELAYLGEQLVAGTNYAFICRTVSADESSTPALIYVVVYEDLEGNASVTDSKYLKLSAQ